MAASRGSLRTLSKIQDAVFCKNSQRLKAVNFFRKTLHLRCLTDLWIWLWLRASIENSKNICFVLFYTVVFQFHYVSFILIFLIFSRRDSDPVPVCYDPSLLKFRKFSKSHDSQLLKSRIIVVKKVLIFLVSLLSYSHIKVLLG